jgi:hypothetical protein
MRVDAAQIGLDQVVDDRARLIVRHVDLAQYRDAEAFQRALGNRDSLLFAHGLIRQNAAR